MLTSTNASPAPPRSTIAAARKLFDLAGSSPSSINVPGVMTRTTSRRTSPFAGTSPIWSQIATRWPCSISRATYPSAAWYGTPAIGMRSPRPMSRPVRTISSTLATSFGVLVERLVEVAQPEEEDRVRMARLHLQVLPTDRGRRQVLGAEQTELIEVGLAHVVVGTRPPRMTLSARLFGGAVGCQYSTRIEPGERGFATPAAPSGVTAAPRSTR